MSGLVFLVSGLVFGMPGFVFCWSGPASIPRAADFAKWVKHLDVSDVLCVFMSGLFDMQKTFPGTFQDFNFETLKSLHF